MKEKGRTSAVNKDYVTLGPIAGLGMFLGKDRDRPNSVRVMFIR